MLTIILAAGLLTAIIALLTLLSRAPDSSELGELRAERASLVTARDELAEEVQRLRPLEAELAAAKATIDEKDAALRRAHTDHGDQVKEFRAQRESLVEMKAKLEALGEKADAAATGGRDAAAGSRRAEELLLGWTKSISNPQSRGALGELAIERQLTDLGLVKGRDFFTQETGNDGRRRDVIVRAGAARVILDSKWTVDPAIGELSEAVRDGDQDELVSWGKRLRDRAKSLAERHYARGQDQGPRLVLMYVPVEGAQQALEMLEDFSIEKFSRETGVYVITPSQVGVAISLVAELWREAVREEQWAELARELSGMGERMFELIQDLDKLGRAIERVVRKYDAIVGRLTKRGGLFRQATALWAHMGKRFKKELLRGADGELLHLPRPREDVGAHADDWRGIEAIDDEAAAS